MDEVFKAVQPDQKTSGVEVISPIEFDKKAAKVAKKKKDLERLAMMEALYKQGSTFEEIAKKFKVSRTTVSNLVYKHGWSDDRKEIREAINRNIVAKVTDETAEYVDRLKKQIVKRLEQLDTEMQRLIDEKGNISSLNLKIQMEALKMADERMRLALGLPDRIAPSVLVNVQMNEKIINIVNQAVDNV